MAPGMGLAKDTASVYTRSRLIIYRFYVVLFGLSLTFAFIGRFPFFWFPPYSRTYP